MAAIWTLGSGSSRAVTTASISGSVSMIFFLMSSSFAPRLANTLKAARRISLPEWWSEDFEEQEERGVW